MNDLVFKRTAYRVERIETNDTSMPFEYRIIGPKESYGLLPSKRHPRGWFFAVNPENFTMGTPFDGTRFYVKDDDLRYGPTSSAWMTPEAFEEQVQISDSISEELDRE